MSSSGIAGLGGSGARMDALRERLASGLDELLGGRDEFRLRITRGDATEKRFVRALHGRAGRNADNSAALRFDRRPVLVDSKKRRERELRLVVSAINHAHDIAAL